MDVSKWTKIKNYVKQVFIAFDQLINAILGGWADETLSARSWRMQFYTRGWKRLRIFIDLLFLCQIKRDKNGQPVLHCEQSFLHEMKRFDLPPLYRKRV